MSSRTQHANVSRAILATRYATVLMLAALAIGLLPRPAVAQVELSLFGGLYAPLNELGAEQVAVGFSGLDGEPAPTTSLSWKHEVGPVFGGRLTVWLGDHLGTEVSLAYTPSDITAERFGLAGGSLPIPPRELQASLLMVSVRAVYRFSSPLDAVSLQVLGGPGVISRGGRVYDVLEGGGISPAVTLGGGLRIRVAPRLLIRLDVESQLYRSELSVPGPEIMTETGTIIQSHTELGSHFQSDLVVVQALVLEI